MTDARDNAFDKKAFDKKPDRGRKNAPTGDTDEIIDAIRRIMKVDKEAPVEAAVVDESSAAAQARILAALDRLTGGTDKAPTVLEALILERLDPLLDVWMTRHLPPLVERLVREEVRAIIAKMSDT